ncbi:TPA: hypothetical protein ACF754_000220 [Legionella pneumophila]|uniref:hypothetical protein n=1 Tax=Legionella pneumophila TaxID=446 RepID=UPI0004854D95|nr:hypothetical protein [Legionella pneumophila]MCZ4734303.1 hypothetical protein [Legionella pneumophila]HAT1738788.1 hypothetical protein [Legionella pneumophila]HAT1744833.1 hypothetical protein [Legionella pneumophila]HAT1748091.1 hypothetical protein [Legionella pneumophila]HAT1753738.1 hypothetical protein [Legionella pneumophila]
MKEKLLLRLPNWPLIILCISFSLFIVALSFIGFAYSYALWRGDKISVETPYIKITKDQSNELKNGFAQIQSRNKEILKIQEQLNTLYSDLKLTDPLTVQSFANSQDAKTQSKFQYKITKINKDLDSLSQLLKTQQNELDAINKSLNKLIEDE